MSNYDHKTIEAKWAKKWIDDKTFTPDFGSSKDPYYALFMFPYPSAEGLHIGNFYSFANIDVMARFKRLQWYEVFEPVGRDAFGIHSENYALKIGETPKNMLERTVKNFRKQLQWVWVGVDWTREVNTTSPEYYKWTQWLFTKLFEMWLAERKHALLNRCPSCKTVLADEQIENGCCERCKTAPEKKEMNQWFFKITKYAQRLLDGLDDMDWSWITKSAQKNWIGRSEWAEVVFDIMWNELTVFTTRPDTLWWATYMVLAPEHPLIPTIVSPEQKEAVENYIKLSATKSDVEREEDKEKTGVFTGAYATNPVNGEKIPVWISDYVLMTYGTGAIMAVPAHDERDYAFAKKFGIKIIEVVSGGDISESAYIGAWKLINSDFLDGLTIDEAKAKIIDWLEKNNKWKQTINYRLRDRCISRQRYRWPPIPIIYCEKCGPQAVPEEDLPVLLPEMAEGREPSGDGKGPLANVASFMHCTCPSCGWEATREADVMDNFLDSAWYFLRYLSPKDEKHLFDPQIGKKRLPVDMYMWWNEHAVLHLMYTRFITMAVHDMGLIDFDTPFKKFRANGMILKDWKKMSKSKWNVINPEEYGLKVGYDALRTYLLFLGPLSENRSFSDEGIMWTKRRVERIYKFKDIPKWEGGAEDTPAFLQKTHQLIKAITEDFEQLKFNTVIAKLMEMTNLFSKQKIISKKSWESFVIMIAPFLPFLAEELWAELWNTESIFNAKRPEFDEKLAKSEKIEFVISINGKVRDKISVSVNITEEEAKDLAMKSDKVKQHIAWKEVVKMIFVKGKMLNIVVK